MGSVPEILEMIKTKDNAVLISDLLSALEGKRNREKRHG
jgi:hypothetical protein